MELISATPLEELKPEELEALWVEAKRRLADEGNLGAGSEVGA
jgi:hypothetical protein